MFPTLIPFNSWDGKTDPSSTEQVVELERFFGPAAIAFNTYQNAVAAIMEVLGSRTNAVPVVLPITAPPDTVAGVLRGGGNPVLLDIDPQTLQINPDMLREVLDEIKAAVVILNRPAGIGIDPRLVEMTKELPTVLDTKDIPATIDESFTFSLYDFQAMAGSGALLIHKYKEQVAELKRIRSGLLGLQADLNPKLAKFILAECKSEASGTRQYTVREYSKLLGDRAFVTEGSNWPYFIARVENADRAVAHLHSHGIEIMKPVVPLHLFSEMNRRWTEAPSYPVAEELHTKLIALPVHCGIVVKDVVEKLLEVAD